MYILAIDPGTTQSAWVVLGNKGAIYHFGMEDNEVLVVHIRGMHPAGHLAIEMVQSYGMPVGKDVFETVLWTGRFIQAWGQSYTLIYRSQVKQALCYDSRAKDSNIRQAVINRYPGSGGGATPQIGTKEKPGPLYGIKRDIWSALAVGLTWLELHKKGRKKEK